jgi:hypothetical protein
MLTDLRIVSCSLFFDLCNVNDDDEEDIVDPLEVQSRQAPESL